MRSILTTLLFFTLLLISGCTDKDKNESLTEGGMKCGPGKCGASMVDGSAVLVKRNEYSNQLQSDSRRECVLKQ